MRASSELHFGVLREGGGTREVGSALSRRVWYVLSGGYAPDSVKAEGSSFVDESGEG